MSRLDIKTANKRFPVEKNLYGVFFEDINRAGDGGLYPELLRNRTFEDSIPPTDCSTEEDDYALVTQQGWRDEFNHGEGLSRWIRDNQTEYTPIPAWYSENAQMELCNTDTLNSNRQVSLRVKFQKQGSIQNTGFCGIPQRTGATYRLLMFAKAKESMRLHVSIKDKQSTYGQAEICVSGEGYKKYEVILKSNGETGDGVLHILSEESGEILIGYISLLPEDTFMGHGLRTDLVQKIKELHPKFLRFPGGCIVEGFSPKTAMYFRNTVGPVWERPGHQLMWHYRSYTGLGFHEYLQLCEDLNMEPLYVINCGMTCQFRKSVLMTGEALQDMLQDALDAMEYAVGPVESKWGSLRAQMGHPAPFKLNYLEIGNENWGEGYQERYKLFYDTLSEKYPHMHFIANEHVEKAGLPAPMVDEHFYNSAEYFAENTDYFNEYDRQGPEIFLGELSVVRGFVAQLYGALGEGAFLIGAEQNQDIVKLISYAPLLENINYSAWFPNLIRFNNRESFVIPAYYTWKLFGQNRGDEVVTSTLETGWLHRPVKGMASLMGTTELMYRNASWNGKEVAVSHELMGRVVKQEEHMLVQMPDTDSSFIIFGEEDVNQGSFDIDIFIDDSIDKVDFTIGVYSSRIPKEMYIADETNPPKEWSPERVKPFLWHIQGNVSSFLETVGETTKELDEKQTLSLRAGTYNHFSYEVDGREMKLYINNELVQTASVPGFYSLASVVTDTEDSIIIKAVNLSPKPDEIDISLDCDVEQQYTAHVLSGEQQEENTLSSPLNVHDMTYLLHGAASSFIYKAPAYSVNVLVLKKGRHA